MNLGSNIARYRKKRGLTQEQFADLLNVSIAAVSKWENDINRPDIEMLPVIADVFQISVDVLLGYKKPHRMRDEIFQQANEKMNQSDYHGTVKLLSDLLIRYPNDFEIVKKLADAYYCITISEQGRKTDRKNKAAQTSAAEKTIFYLERCLDLFDEKLYPDSSVESILVLMASVFSLKEVGRYDEAISLLETYNVNGKYNHLLAQIYYNSGKKEDARKLILEHCVSRQIFIFNDLSILADMYYQDKAYVQAAEILTAEITSYQLFMNEDGGYADRAYAAKAETISHLYELAGDAKKSRDWHRTAVQYARKYMKNPSMLLSSLRFCEKIPGQMVDNHDELISRLSKGARSHA